MQNRIDPLQLLSRTDKWFVGGGTAGVYAPPFPTYADVPGFWDESYYADIRLERLFGFMILDASGSPISLHRVIRRWRPDRLTQMYILGGQPGITLTEERVITPSNVFSVKLTFSTSEPSRNRLNLIAWTMQPSGELKPEVRSTTQVSTVDVLREPDVISYARCILFGETADTPADVYGWNESPSKTGKVPQDRVARRLFIAMGADRLPDSTTINLCEGTPSAPLYDLSVFPEKFRNGSLAQENDSTAGWNPNGLLHIAQHYVLEPRQGQDDTICFGAAVALKRERAVASLRSDVASDPIAISERAWRDYFNSLPHLTSSDEHIVRYYWYRWYGLRLMTVDMRAETEPGREAGHQNLRHPCVFEGPGAFRSHVSYSAQCHAREASWMADRSVAMGSIENFLAAQNADGESENRGFIPGHLYLWQNERGFYHADWGTVAMQLYLLSGDRNFVRRVYPGLSRYADYIERVRDKQGSGLVDILDQGETGQEYMSRYMFADQGADTWKSIRMKGVDSSCYGFSLYATLSSFAEMLGYRSESQRFKRLAALTRDAIRDKMWDSEAGIFKDYDSETRAQSPYSAAVGFYPLMYDIASEPHLSALLVTLADPDRFGTLYPVPSSPVNDPYFDASGAWKGKRTNCPWNGRTWPMTNSHVVDAFAHGARKLSRTAAPAAAEKLHQFIKMLFFDGDPALPNSYEHYNPNTGTPSLYRGIDDYQHSWVIDLIIRHIAGIQPEPGPGGGILIDPLPAGISSFDLQDVPVRGHLVGVRWSAGAGFIVTVNGTDRVCLDNPCTIEIDPK